VRPPAREISRDGLAGFLYFLIVDGQWKLEAPRKLGADKAEHAQITWRFFAIRLTFSNKSK
jgi:hypothetical protein